MASVAQPPSPLAAWWHAARPATLGVSVVPVAVGTSVAVGEGVAHAGLACLAGLTALLLQVASNLANDVYDHARGADRADRLGPPRAVQQGWLAPDAVRRATWLVLALAVASGLGLVAAGGWPLLVVGALALSAALAYTAGPFPLAYHGLGDAAVFVFFGPVAVAGAHYVQAGSLSPTALWLSVPMGLLAAAILAVNNLRDRPSDARVGKRTLAVRLGARRSRLAYAATLALPYVLIALVAATERRAGLLLPALTAPLAIGLARQVLGGCDGSALNPVLVATARLLVVFGAALALGALL